MHQIKSLYDAEKRGKDILLSNGYDAYNEKIVARSCHNELDEWDIDVKTVNDLHIKIRINSNGLLKRFDIIDDDEFTGDSITIEDDDND